MGGEVQVESGTFRRCGPGGGGPRPDRRNKVCLSPRLFPRAKRKRPFRPRTRSGGEGGRVPPHTPRVRMPPRGGIRAHVFARNPPPPSRATLGSLRHDKPDAIGRARLDALNKPPGLGEFEHAARLGV